MFHISHYLPTLGTVQFADWIFYFMFYSFLGWVFESIKYSLTSKKCVNAGFLIGPLCPPYGIISIIMLLLSQTIVFKSNVLMLLTLFFAFAFVIIAFDRITFKMGEFFTGLPAGLNTKRRKSGQIITLAITAVVLAIVSILYVFFLQPSLIRIVKMIPSVYRRAITSGLIVLLIIDFIFSMRSLHHFRASMQSLVTKILTKTKQPTKETVTKEAQDWAAALPWNEKRFLLAFPKTMPLLCSEIEAGNVDYSLKRKAKPKPPKQEKSFAAGLNLYKLLWVFIIASIIGFTIESLFCLATKGYIESRQGLLYGPISQIYGFGACFMVLCVYPIRNKKPIWVFLATALVGGVFEAAASFIQQKFFGSVSWDYQNPLQVPLFGGRTCLAFMAGWGALGLVFIRYIYPALSRWIEDIPNKQGRTLSLILFVVLLVDGILSIGAVSRWNQRQQNIPAKTEVQRILDEIYPNSFMEQIYPNMIHKLDDTK